MTKFCYFNGEIVPMEQAQISINNNTLHYGTGCFAGIRGYWNEEQEQLYVFRLRDHFKRFTDSSRILLAELDETVDELAAITVELLAREGWRENCYIRPVAYKNVGVFRVWLHDADDKVAIFSIPVGSYIKKEGGLKVCVSSWRRVDDTSIPARGKINGSYVNSALIKSEAMLNGFDEAIVLNQDGHVSEGSAANFMIVRDGVLISPTIADNILEGVTRRTLLQLAREELGIPVQERVIDRSELYVCDEAFFCGTGVQFAPIATIDQRPVGGKHKQSDGDMGPISQRLSALYFDIVYGRNEKFMHWLTPVPTAERVAAVA